MKRMVTTLAAPAALLAAFVAPAFGGPGPAHEDDEKGKHKAYLRGYEEVPAVSTNGKGEFTARVTTDGTVLEYKLSYRDLEGVPSTAELHFAQSAANGGLIAVLCVNPATATTPACPPSPGTVEGTLNASEILGPAAQGIAAAEFQEALRAIRQGLTYVNLKTAKFPDGEIRGQVRRGYK
ncbi:MAG TPA: CHRD domain-containing protein [Methylomirabilota bacterium]|jgi:hypothetical protein|nr:CHRD domain-containing protein [Methylomirabilota bacterium]